jgi:flagellar basal-body rod protein FlgF
MNGGIYTLYSGMRAQMEALDVVANNLANLNTSGFKEEKAFFTVLDNEINAGELTPKKAMVQLQSVRSGSVGQLEATQRDLDIAIDGNGVIAVDTPQGTRYTRNGHLNINSKGMLCAAGNAPVMGDKNKPIVLGPGPVVINQNGEVYQNNARVNRIQIVAFDSPNSLIREGDSLMTPSGKSVTQKAADVKVMQGYLEQSNVNAVACCVSMVGILRQFESMQKSVNVVMNDINAKAIEKLGR